MATGADIPPELFSCILRDVCEDADWLLDLRYTVPNRKEAIKNVTACSLTCVYWAHVCREKLFQRVWIKNYEDMRAFARLVSNTPTRFTPISEYVMDATLVQRVGDRLWLHLQNMQPSLFRLQHVYTRFHIEDSPDNVNAPSSGCSVSKRLFRGLPRTPPSSCLWCMELTIDRLHFVTPRDLTSLLQKLRPYRVSRLTNVTWDAQAHVESALLTRDPLLISESPLSDLNVEVHHSAYTAETAWLAFITTLRGRSTQGSTVTSASEYDAYDENEHRPTLQVLSSAQRAILDICKSVGKVFTLSVTYASFDIPTSRIAKASTDILLKDMYARAYCICNTMIHGYEAAGDELLSGIQLVFYGTQAVIPVTNVSNSIVIDSVSVLCAHIASTEGFTTAGRSSNALPTHPPYSWAEIVGLCAAQAGFIRMQLEFDSHEYLVQFMEAQHAALGKLHGRIALFYDAKDGDLRAADFETLADLGDADEHDYIDPYY